jgi:hypothetical protein
MIKGESEPDDPAMREGFIHLKDRYHLP